MNLDTLETREHLIQMSDKSQNEEHLSSDDIANLKAVHGCKKAIDIGQSQGITSKQGGFGEPQNLQPHYNLSDCLQIMHEYMISTCLYGELVSKWTENKQYQPGSSLTSKRLIFD